MRKTQIQVADFSKGLWSRRAATNVPSGAVADCQNVIFDAGAPIERRPGYRQWSSADIATRPIRTLFPWDRMNGTRVVLAGVRNGSNNEVWQADEGGAFAGSAVTGGTGFATTYEMEFASALDNVYMVNGSDATQRYDGTTMAAAGVDGSTPGAPTAGAPAGGPGIPNNGGSGYQWSVTFVYGSRGESLAGTQSGTQAPNNQTVGLTGVPTGPSGTTARRIYRRDLSATTNPRVFVGEIADNTTTTFTDDNSAWDAARRARTSAATPPISRYIVWHPGQNRMHQFWQTGDRSRWWWSELRTPDIVLSTNSDYISRDDGQDITGAIVWRDRIFITKTRSCFALIGLSPSEWQLQTVDRSVGCAHNRTMAATPRGVIFAGVEGVWLYDGVGLRLLSDPIDNIWRNLVMAGAENKIEWTTVADFTTAGSSSGTSTGTPSGSFSE